MRLPTLPTVIPQSTRQSRLQFGDINPSSGLQENTDTFKNPVKPLQQLQSELSDMSARLQKVKAHASKAQQLASEATEKANQVQQMLLREEYNNARLPIMIRFFMPWTWF
jgi:type VI protein secretion system component VasF